MGKKGLQLILPVLSLLLLSSSMSSSDALCSLTYRRQSLTNVSNTYPSPTELQFFRNVSNMAPFHKVQFFRSRLLQHGFPTGSHVPPAAWSSMGFPQDHSFLQASICLSMGSFRDCKFHGNSMGYRGIPALASLPPPYLLNLVSAELLVSYSHSSLWLLLHSRVFFLFITMLSLRCYHCC